MTDQQPHTPTTEEVRLNYAYLGGTVGEREFDRRTETFDRWLAARDARIEAAAEQRGAEKALRELAKDAALVPAAPDKAAKFYRDRADQMEDDDETH